LIAFISATIFHSYGGEDGWSPLLVDCGRKAKRGFSVSDEIREYLARLKPPTKNVFW
jgi:hypothetical protein